MKLPIFEVYPNAWQDLMLPPVFTPRKLYKADLYTLTLSTAQVLRYSAGDVDFNYNGNNWDSHSVRFGDKQSPPTAHWKTGMDVDTWQVMAFPRLRDAVADVNYPDTIGSIPWIAATLGGALDGAEVTVDRAYLAAYPDIPAPSIVPTVVYRIFSGEMGAVDLWRGGAALTINSSMELFSQNMPRNVFAAGCRYSLFSPGCTLDPNLWQKNSVVGSGSTQGTINAPTLPDWPVDADGNRLSYALGRIKMTSGANAGYQRSIRAWSPGGVLTLLAPFYFPIAVGDTFAAWPGCNKSQLNCDLFSNRLNFGGQPYIPAPETAI